MTFSLDAHGAVGGDLTATGDNLNIKGAIARDVVAAGNAITLNGKVGRHAKVDGTTLKLKDDAAIAGNVTYTSANKADIANGAVITGDTVHTTPKAPDSGWGFNLGFYLFALCGLLLLGLSLAFFFPQFIRRTSGHIKRSFGKSLLTGILASLGIPAIMVILTITVVGVPLAVALLLAGLLAAVLSGPIVGYYVGGLVLRNQKNPLLILLAGSTIVITAYFLPVLGLLAILMSYWLGMGALLLALAEQVKPGQQPAK
jgi:hypothetical protein